MPPLPNAFSAAERAALVDTAGRSCRLGQSAGGRVALEHDDARAGADVDALAIDADCRVQGVEQRAAARVVAGPRCRSSEMQPAVPAFW